MEVELKSFDDTKNFIEYDGVSGIYAFVYHDEVIYIGQSNNIRRRLLAHHGVNNKLKLYKNNYSPCGRQKYEFYQLLKKQSEDINFLVVPGEIEKLNELEEHYVNKYKPKYNWSGVHTKFGNIKRY